MRFALFVSVVSDEHDSPVKVRPEKVFAITQDPERVDVCELHVPGGVFVVRGTVEEVSAALEAAGAPAVAPAVEVAPTDLGQVAALLDLFAEDGIVWSRVDCVLGLDDTAGWDETRGAIKAIAAKLRGGGR